MNDTGRRERTIPAFLRPPKFGSRLEEVRARTLAPILLLTLGLATIVLVTLPFSNLDDPVAPLLVIYGLLLAVPVLSAFLMRQGRIREAGAAFGIGGWLISVAMIVSYGGLMNHLMVTAVGVVIVSGFVWSERAAVWMAVSYAVVALVLAWGQGSGLFSLGGREVLWWRAWISFAGCLAAASILLVIGLRRIRSALEEASRNEVLVRASRERLRQLADRLETVREEERRSVARTVHDELGQTLTALKLDLSRRLPALAEGDGGDGAVMIGHIDQMIEVVRNLAVRLRPDVLDTLGLAAAVEWEVDRFSERSGVACTVESDLDEAVRSLDADRATALFRIVQEALTNIARHSEAKSAQVRLHRTDSTLALDVLDDGRGILAASVWSAGSSGLIGMRERAGNLDGSVEITRRPEGGTRLAVRIPA